MPSIWKNWKKGFASWMEYRSLLAQAQNPQLKGLLFLMDKIGIVLRGSTIAYSENFLKRIDNLAAVAATSNLLIKIVKEKKKK
ncbi:hypothetical protein [Coxiella-like endosymbiont]|uniref:hypothetical protein n=1 Tax=Coxiella-like endosymbiont TaxID=1592897 RepID=UPI00272D1003|nr:hypothetical protein [Coxiella-like endosymbiont]